ncbi:MAG: DUF262 domain-containing protein, partial [Synergistaceae bacterium]|nr:DUF262 domain-containing protein [Synergistaceae bacterium]
MSELSVDQKTILALLGDRNADFLIPDYQRPYEWEKSECETLWNDLFTFAIPDGDSDKFNSKKDAYFLGPIVTIAQEDKPLEIIDGQQRITTLMLLLRAFYTKYGKMQDEQSVKTRTNLEKCLWKADELENIDMNSCKLETEVATDDSRKDFTTILKTGDDLNEQKSNYAKNYRFFLEKIDDLKNNYAKFIELFIARILNNCILLPIKANSQDMAMRIFSTLNDRGKPLSDSDIFKAQFYKYYSQLGRKDEFIEKWKDLEELCSEIYHPNQGTPMDEAFTRYMYYERARQGNKNTTLEGLRKFYEKNSYALLKNDKTFENIIDLTNFWKSVSISDKLRFSERVRKRFFVLHYAPNLMWTYITSVYYLANRDNDGILDDDKFYDFLNKITAFILAYSFTNPGFGALKSPIFSEMLGIIKGNSVDFSEYKFDMQQLKNAIDNYVFSNNRPLTKSMLAWWAFSDENQPLLDFDKSFQTEHIYAKNHKKSLTNPANLEVLGNKVLLERGINIRATDYKFSDKVD